MGGYVGGLSHCCPTVGTRVRRGFPGGRGLSSREVVSRDVFDSWPARMVGALLRVAGAFDSTMTSWVAGRAG